MRQSRHPLIRQIAAGDTVAAWARIEAVLRRHQGVVRHAARALGMDRGSLYRYSRACGRDLADEAARYRLRVPE